MVLKVVIASVIAVIVVVSLIIPFTGNPVDNNDVVDVILIDGQSNGAYYVPAQYPQICQPELVNQEIGEPSHKALYYGTENAQVGRYTIDQSSIREMYRDGQWVLGCYEPVLAYYQMEKNGRDVAIINVAMGGMDIEYLSEGYGWLFATKIIKAATSELKTMYSHLNYVGWIMAHGEADSVYSTEHYIEYFNELNKNLDKYHFKDCYVIMPRPVYTTTYEAFVELIADNPDVHLATDITSTFTTSNGLLSTDNVHYTQQGRIVAGEKVIDALPPDKNDTVEINISEISTIIPIIIVIGILLMIVRFMFKY